MRREGSEINHKRLLRIYQEGQLHVRNRGGRKRAIGTPVPIMLPLMANKRWSFDPRHGHSDHWRFHGSISDRLPDGRRFRIMTVVDDCTRECLALIADTSLSRVTLAVWRTDYNTERPHSRPGWQTPAVFAQTSPPVVQPAQMDKSKSRSLAHAG